MMRISEISTIKPKTPEQARIDTLAKGVDRARDALSVERNKQKITKAQRQIQTAHVPPIRP